MGSLSKFEQFRRTFVIIGGVIFIVMGVFHLSFWILFDWQSELTKLNQINDNNMQMLNIVVCFFMFSFSYMLLMYNSRVLNSKLGRSVLIISSGFFLIRALIEFAFPGNSLVFGVVLMAFIPVYLIPALTMTSK
jgi:hypothetical protein